VAQIFGTAFSVGIGETIVVSVAVSKLENLLPRTPPSILRGLLGGTANAAFLSTLSDATRAAVKDALVSSIDKAYILAIAASGIGLICSLLLPRERVGPKPTVSSNFETFADISWTFRMRTSQLKVRGDLGCRLECIRLLNYWISVPPEFRDRRCLDRRKSERSDPVPTPQFAPNEFPSKNHDFDSRSTIVHPCRNVTTSPDKWSQFEPVGNTGTPGLWNDDVKGC
jgi:hypothetical protein